MLNFLMERSVDDVRQINHMDARRMKALIRYTARSMETSSPVPFGAFIVDAASGRTLFRALNAVRSENDPSSHAELRAVRKATRKLKSNSLAGYILYTTCEPCPMCMANALWAGIDRVVYGATIEDAGKHCRQIYIAATELVGRSDMHCVVEGPLLRKECYELFTHPNMLATFATWNPKS